MAFRTLISTAVLASHMDDPAYAIVDCRSKLDDLEWGAREYAAAHIPGAVYADLTHDLSGPKTGTNGRHPLPDPDALVQTFGRLGIASGVQVVAYDQENGMFASRLWWLLRWLGHDAVAVLDGGFKKWTAEGRPVESGETHRAPRAFTGSPRADMAVDVQTVASHLGARRPAPGRRPRAGALPRRHRADRQGRRPHPRREESFLPVEPRRAGTVPHAGGTAREDHRVGRRRARGSDRLLLRIRRHRLPQPARVRARRPHRREAVPRIVVRVVVRSRAADREGITYRPCHIRQFERAICRRPSVRTRPAWASRN